MKLIFISNKRIVLTLCVHRQKKNNTNSQVISFLPLSDFQIAYLIFLITFSYVVLVKMETTPSNQELYVIFYIATMGCEKVREIISSEPVAIRYSVNVFACINGNHGIT